MPNAKSIFWASAKFEVAANAARAKTKTRAMRSIFNLGLHTVVLRDWMQLATWMLQCIEAITRIYVG
jgi:hypothetical protein